MNILVGLLLLLIPAVLSELPTERTNVDYHKTTFLKAGQQTKYPFEVIDNNFRQNRRRIAQCLWMLNNPISSRVDLHLQFESNSRLKEIFLTPSQSSDVRHCLFEVISDWNLPPNPTSRPFSYQIHLKI